VEYPPEYIVQHFSVGVPLLIHPLYVDGIWRIFDDTVPMVIYTGDSFFLPAKFERCVPLEMKTKGTSVSPTPSVV
jgi:hypothetical protein